MWWQSRDFAIKSGTTQDIADTQKDHQEEPVTITSLISRGERQNRGFSIKRGTTQGAAETRKGNHEESVEITCVLSREVTHNRNDKHTNAFHTKCTPE